MITIDDLINMKLHEAKRVFDDTELIKIPNGWIYTFYKYDYEKDQKYPQTSSCFVPERI